jgi:hypothetical protein
MLDSCEERCARSSSLVSLDCCKSCNLSHSCWSFLSALRWIVLSESYCWFIELKNLRMLLLTQSIQSSWCGYINLLLNSLDNFALWKKKFKPIGLYLYHVNLGLATVRKLGNFRYILIPEIINMFMTIMSDSVKAKHVLVFKLNLK